MSKRPHTILVVGATGSVGRFVVAEALKQGYATRALVRNLDKAKTLPEGALAVVGDLTDAATLDRALAGTDAVVFTHGSNSTEEQAEAVDYGAVRSVLTALGDRSVRVALMTAIGMTKRDSIYNKENHGRDWKRRGERLLRASGLEYTIVRPAAFDYNAPDAHKLVMRQGEHPSNGGVAREQIARVLVDALSNDAARHKTFELLDTTGEEQADLTPLFAALQPDEPAAADAPGDSDNLPLSDEPQRVLDDLKRLTDYE
ncbi:SDR family oxidoreductase [Propionibacterium freudenreichii]|uniref:SDR family oxidoreductase n=1 Tax=Propionibacterium freudenreichii TaxID=1744 RepID=UPI0038553225